MKGGWPIALALIAAALPSPGRADAAGPAAPLVPHFAQVGAAHVPRDVVAALAQDGMGFLWIGTGDGLVRHDGHRYRAIERDTADAAHRNLGWVRALAPGRDGRMWIGTEVDGLLAWSTRDDRLEDHRDPQAAAGPLATIRALAEDVDGSVWIGTLGSGLQRHDPRTGRTTPQSIAPAAPDIAGARIEALLVDRQGNLWVGSWHGLARRRAGRSTFEALARAATPSAAAPPAVRALVQASDGRIWFGTAGGGIGIVDPERDDEVHWVPQPTDATGAVTALVEAPGGVMWVGRDDGVDLVDARMGSWLRRLRHDPRDAASLGAGEVTALLRDRANAIWVAGYGLGLQRHDPTHHAIAVRAADADPHGAFQDADVRALLATRDGPVWVAPASGELVVLDQRLQGAVRLRPWPDARPARVEAMAQAPDGTVWLAARGWLLALDRQRRVVTRLHHDAGTVYRLRPHDDGGLWLCSQSGLWRLDAGAKAPRRIAGVDGQPFTADVFDLVAAPDGTLWVGTVAGLHRLGPGAHGLETVPAEPGAQLGSPIVIGLLLDRHGRLWLDTSVAGLHRLTHWDGHRARFDGISLRHGLAHRPFGANLHEDERGRIWTQMYVYDPAADALHEITAADGAAFGTPWFFSTARLGDGRLLFGGSKGILVVQPEQVELASRSPRPLAAELRVDGRRRPMTTAVRGTLALAPGERRFAVDFTVLDYADPRRVHYAYRLDGLDPDWIDAQPDASFASYGNLAPGHYLLRVRAARGDGAWGPEELAWPVQVLPAWWQHPAARVAMAVVALALAALALRWRVRRLVRRQRELEALVHERTRALEEASLTDPLTGLRNRRYFTAHIDADATRAMRRHEDAARAGQAPDDDADLLFVLVDIDHFKQVNDRHGHAVGDAALRHVAQRLQAALRESDPLVRWGGEEFLVVARGLARACAADLAERLRHGVAAWPLALPDGSVLRCTVSVGFAAFPLDPGHPRASGWSAAVRLADAALYQAKCAGRDAWAGVVGLTPGHRLDPDEQRPAREWLDSGELQVLRGPPPAGTALNPGAPRRPTPSA